MSANTYLTTPKSIRTRLTLFYTLAVFILLSLAAIFLYWATITLLYKADYEFLQDEVETIQYIMQSLPHDNEALKEAVIMAPFEEEGSIYRYFIRILLPNNQVLIQTPGFEDVFPSEKMKNIKALQLGKKRKYWYSKDDTDYLVVQSPLRIGDKHTVGLVEIALDLSYQHSIIHDRSKIIGGLLVGTLLALIFGFFIANRGLRSLFLLTQSMEKITATSLDQRIDPKSWPAELAGIGVAFNQMLDRMETSFTRLKQFSADLSHELRTPITNLIGATEISLSYDHNEVEYRKVMESNLEELQHLSSLIENILFLARAENPHYEVKKSILHLRNEIALVCEFYQAMADEKNIRMSCQGDAIIHANADMFRRVISNLLSNALKYTKENGIINITIIDQESTAQILIEDNGIGIAKENLPRIFDRFYRADAARSPQFSGVGLGLAIVKSIIEVHHGSIAISSEEGKGTTLSVLFPK